MRRRVLVLACGLGLAACGGVASEDKADPDLDADDAALRVPADAEFVDGQVLVQFREGTSEAGRIRALGRAHALRVESVDTEPLRATVAGPLELERLPAGMGVAYAVMALRADPAVLFAEPNWIYRHQAVRTIPSDPSFGQQWGLHNTGQSINGGAGGVVDVDIDAPEAWTLQRGSRTVWVGVVDEGIDYRHPDLANVVINPGEDINHDGVITAADFDGIDNDGNGFVDDVRGWDFVNNDNSIYDGGAGDNVTDAHGTHVSGTLGAIGNNARGVVGVNWTVRLVSAKFLGPNGGTAANAVRAVDYITGLKRRGVNVVATNDSWGGGGFSQALQDAIGRANAAGVLFVAAAGNGGADGIGDNTDRTPFYPASYPNANIISVAAIDRFDRLASFSNFGRSTVDLGAPGVSILSTTPNGTYSFYSGTSMATAYVTGLCALHRARNGAITAAQIKSRVLSRVVRTGALSGKVVSNGRENAYRSLVDSTAVDP